MDKPLANPPLELKAITPFVQRANELRAADKVIAYWCCYNAAQVGISANAKEQASKLYLLDLMDTLEALKSQLADNDAVTNDAASSAYVENFALKVFVGADNEDRSGKGTRATAKKFLVASQFLELLKIFGPVEGEMLEKIKYAKWKAADIAKAFKEGRTPQPGPAGGDLKEEAADIEFAMAPAAADSKEEEEYLAREMAKLQAPDPVEEDRHTSPLAPAAQATKSMVSSDDEGDAAIPSARSSLSLGASASKARMSMHVDGGSLSPNFSKPLPTQLSRNGSLADVDTAVSAVSGQAGALTGTDEPWKHAVLDENDMQRQSSASSSQGHAQPLLPPSSSHVALPSPGSRPLPVPPHRVGLPDVPVSAHQQISGSSPSGLSGAGGPGAAPASFWITPSPPSEQSNDAPTVLPSVPSELGASSPSPFSPSDHPAIQRIDPVLPSAPSFPSTPSASDSVAPNFGGVTAPSAPLAPASLVVQPQQPVSHVRGTPTPATQPSPVVATDFPETLSPLLSTRVQKLAKGAASAVDFEDLDTARIQLRQALDILEGRVTK